MSVPKRKIASVQSVNNQGGLFDTAAVAGVATTVKVG